MIVFATLLLLLFDAPCTLKAIAGLLLLDTLLEWIRASSLLLCALSDGIFPDALMASVCVAGGQWLTNIKNICHSSFILVSTNAVCHVAASPGKGRKGEIQRVLTLRYFHIDLKSVEQEYLSDTSFVKYSCCKKKNFIHNLSEPSNVFYWAPGAPAVTNICRIEGGGARST